jgi:hypothetical protein
MDLRYSGTLSKDEYLAQLKLNSRPVLAKGGFHFDFWALFGVIGVLLVLLAALGFSYAESFRSNLYIWNSLELIGGILMLVLAWKVRAVPAKFWEENKDSISSIAGRISEEAILVETANGNLRLEWSEITGYGEYGDLVVLYKLPTFALPFLARFFDSQQEWLTFRKMVGDRIQITHRVEQRHTPSRRNKLFYALFLLSILVMLIYYFAHGAEHGVKRTAGYGAAF